MKDVLRSKIAKKLVLLFSLVAALAYFDDSTSAATSGNCSGKCNLTKIACDSTCNQKRVVCIAQCGLPLPGSSYVACTQKCSDDEGRCSIGCQAQEKVCLTACKLP
jgi:hypothetical protein